jgi:TolB-like protein/Tfp pilus assembly protein PilF
MKPSFFVELQRRNVLRAAAFYAAAAWLLIQVATQVFPFFDIPSSVVRVVVVAAIIGFPVAMVLAWFYELTPEGLKRESELDRSDPRVQASAKRFDRWIIAALSLAVVVLLSSLFMRHGDIAGAGSGNKEIVARSIAVLPFENLSTDPGNAFFADGIQDEILTRLAKIGALKVISRTSTLQFASKPENVPEIARQLGVANILEGSVQRAGNAVRVTVQLIKAATDEHLWAETYDRKLDDIFAVESEVAQSIASSLQVELSGGEQAAVAARATANAAAHEAFLRADALDTHSTSSSFDVPRSVAELYGEAVRLDPDYAQAWAHLAIIKSYMYLNFIDRTPEQLAEVKHAADTALRLQPELGEAYLALGYYRYRCLRDFEGGLQAFEQARARLPNNADVAASIAYIQRRLGKWQESVDNLERAAQLDPRAMRPQIELATNYSALRDFPRARATLDRALAVSPDSRTLIAAKAASYQEEGNLEDARKLLAGLPKGAFDAEAFMVQINQMLLERRFADASTALNAALPHTGGPGDTMQGYCYAYLAWVHRWAGDEADHKGNFARALEIAQALRKSDADDAGLAQIFAIVYAGLGNETEAVRWARRGLELNSRDAVEKPRMEETLAEVLGWFGHTDEAVAMVPHLLEVPNGETRAMMRLHPVWDSLRNDARFRQIIDQDGATTASAKSP